jgi:hypothetical protein
MVRRAHYDGVKVLGIDGFFISPNATEPSMANSIDFTTATLMDKDPWEMADDFLASRMHSSLYFEVVVDQGEVSF